MAEPFRDLVGPQLVATVARHLRRVAPAFPAARFRALATTGLAALELKARVAHVAAALTATLPASFADACDVLEASLAPARDDDRLDVLVPAAHGLAGWAVWPLCTFVERQGLAEPQRALAALHALTQRHTAEYTLRPFLVAHERLVLRTLRQWVDDPSPHVRRLVSEGSRPRLPWGLRLQRFVADPSPVLPLLAALQDDPSAYVRRSVANHLNDVAKDHPQRVAEWLERHLPAAGPQRRALLRHASRTLLKRGDPRVLAAWGLGTPFRGDVSVRIMPARVRVGAAMVVAATLRSAASRPQRIMIDYVVHHRRASGATSAKVWKGWAGELAPHAARTFTKRHSWRPVTTRTDQPGRHDVELLVNGRVAARTSFELRP